MDCVGVVLKTHAKGDIGSGGFRTTDRAHAPLILMGKEERQPIHQTSEAGGGRQMTGGCWALRATGTLCVASPAKKTRVLLSRTDPSSVLCAGRGSIRTGESVLQLLVVKAVMCESV